MPQPSQNYKVIIQCYTYNHEKYIEDALKGFVMQKTNFPFCAIVVDDFSSDKTAEIINNYEEQYPDIIKGIYLQENYHSQKKKKAPLLKPWIDRTNYIALCEGDDYWIDENKLQKQVDYMELHPECTMTCCRTKWYSVKKAKYCGEQYCMSKNGALNPIDVINRTGLYISTCSIMYRKNIIEEYPEYCKKCAVGDYPLQIYCAMKGYIYYFNSIFSVYRVDNPESWMGRQQWGKFSMERLKIVKSRIEMLNGFAQDYPLYKKIFEGKIADEINRNYPKKEISSTNKDLFLSYFSEYIKKYTLRWKIDLWIRMCNNTKIRRYYTNKFLRKYNILKTFYTE